MFTLLCGAFLWSFTGPGLEAMKSLGLHTYMLGYAFVYLFFSFRLGAYLLLYLNAKHLYKNQHLFIYIAGGKI